MQITLEMLLFFCIIHRETKKESDILNNGMLNVVFNFELEKGENPLKY